MKTLKWILVCLFIVFLGQHTAEAQVIDQPGITITTAAATSDPVDTKLTARLNVEFRFGTVSGTYSTCTVQAYTTYNGTNFLTIGSAASITVTSGTVNAWTINAGSGTSVSATAAQSFGPSTKFGFSCSSYGTTAPVTISATVSAISASGSVSLDTTPFTDGSQKSQVCNSSGTCATITGGKLDVNASLSAASSQLVYTTLNAGSGTLAVTGSATPGTTQTFSPVYVGGVDANGKGRGMLLSAIGATIVDLSNTAAVTATLAAETTKVIGTVNVAASQTIAVTNTGTFAVQAASTLAAETTKVIGTVRTGDGSGNLLTSAARGSERALSVQIVDGSGAQVTTFGGAGGTSSNFGSAFPSAGTAIGIALATGNMTGATGDTAYNLKTATCDTGGLCAKNDTEDASIAAGQVAQLTTTMPYLYDGSTWVRPTGITLGSAITTGGKAPIMGVIGYYSDTGAAMKSTDVALVGGKTSALVNTTLLTNADGAPIIVTGTTALTTTATLQTQTDTVMVGGINVKEINGVTPLMGNGVTGTGALRVSIASDSTGVVQPGNTANTTPWLVTDSVTASTGATATTFATSSAASTNSTNVKSSAGNIYGLRLENTTTTIYYLRLYNASSAPTCSSATNFVESIPIPPAAAAGGAGGIVEPMNYGQAFTTGISYCLTGGGGNNDNTNAATGVYVSIKYK